MNERIRKLADNCRSFHRDGHGEYLEIFDEEKFARLLIAECANICVKQSLEYIENTQIATSGAAGRCGHLIKQEFGIE